MPNDKVLMMIGLCKRAGKITSGAYLCERDIKAKRTKLIIIAKDTSDNSKKAIMDACNYHNVEFIEYGKMTELGNSVGAEGARTVVSVNDTGFADAVKYKYTELQTGRKGE